MAGHDSQPAKEWGLNRLPLELRLRIWEETWPGPRLIEVTLPPGAATATTTTTTTAPRRIKPSRQVGAEKVTAWNSRTSSLEDVSCRSYAHPSALQVCRESRAHTLATYRALRPSHPAGSGGGGGGAFYFDPGRDVLWLHRDLSQFDAGSLGAVERVLFKDVERAGDSGADKKQRRRELLEMVESSMGRVREVMVLVHWTSIADLDGDGGGGGGGVANKTSETLYDWMQYYMFMLDECWDLLDHQPWVLQFLSTWDEFGVCFESRGEAKLWGDAREGPLYGCPSHDVVYRKRLVERFPKRFVDIQRI
ncbi:hypothetical protein KVR01_000906 [Diaporthe batatas]|uniref:uncharacterized protein n=1 Tax=Diaporthe batatas TaxID=748121 RepID=UPI001D0481FB|nr:uncharacterized protein KVR01_000906 [Diaporthe batatas]KAG8170161.1 hypothetical protein KVR01_000906 [Diaporthe batatas]